MHRQKPLRHHDWQHLDAVVFDAYGTLLNVHAAMARHAKRLGSN
jgi:FMN phosphatase YigB (HAD superfamily)